MCRDRTGEVVLADGHSKTGTAVPSNHKKNTTDIAPS